MRVLMKISLPVDTANMAAVDGSMTRTVKEIVDETKPEAAYFMEENGKRTAFLVVNLADPSQIPALAEPWFLAFSASVEIHPAMNADDLAKATSGIERAVKKYGARVSARLPKAA